MEWEGQAAQVEESWGHVPGRSGTDRYTASLAERELTSQLSTARPG